MGAVLTGIGLFLYYRTEHDIDTAINQALTARQGGLRAYVATVTPDRPSIPPGERFAQILTPDGKVIESRPARAAPLLSPAEAARASAGVVMIERHEHDRFLAGPTKLDGRPVVAVAATSLADREHALEGLGGALLVGGPAALLLAAFIAYAVAARALGTVESMRLRAAEISSAEPYAALPVPSADDEIRRLGITLNDMLARMASAAEHERAFVANASHELRTPIAALSAELELALRHGVSTEDLRNAIVAAKGDTDRLAALASGLLDLAQADEAREPTRDHVDLDRLLAAAKSSLQHAADAQGRSIELHPSGLAVLGDEEALARAIRNLLDNAILHGRGEIALGATQESKFVRIWINDEGGLDAGLHSDQAFTRFVRGPAAIGRPGAGLGLALVGALAKAQGGTAEFERLPGGGVRASVLIPIA